MRYLLASIFLWSAITSSQAQNAGGGSATTGGVDLAWSVGELGGSALGGADAMLTPGPIQPRDFAPEKVAWQVTEVLLAYPNPVQDQVTLRWPGEHTLAQGTIRLYNVLGHQVLEQAYTERLSLLELPPGVYLLEVTTNRRRAVARIRKE